MRKILGCLITVLFMFCFAEKTFAQEPIYDFVSVKKQPQFPGGIKKFFDYTKSELKNSKSTKTGKVFLTFIVELDGSLTNLAVTRGLGKVEDEEAMNILRKSPKWAPGEMNGKKVRVKYNININFN